MCMSGCERREKLMDNEEDIHETEGLKEKKAEKGRVLERVKRGEKKRDTEGRR